MGYGRHATRAENGNVLANFGTCSQNTQTSCTRKSKWSQKTKLRSMVLMNVRPGSRTRSNPRSLNYTGRRGNNCSLHSEWTCSAVCCRRRLGEYATDDRIVIFMKTQSPVEPVQFVQKICEDAMKQASQKRTRFVKRLTPMTLLGRASKEGLENVAKEVLAPHFHQQPFQPRKVSLVRQSCSQQRMVIFICIIANNH